LKPAFVAILSGAALLILAACGGGSSSSSTSTTATTSGILKRALVTDKFNGVTHIFDAATDTTKGNTISTGGGSSILGLFPDKKHTIVVASGNNSVSVVDNTTETVVANFPLPNFTESIALSADNKTVYAAVRNAPVLGQISGLIEIMDITATTGAPTGNIQVPAVRRLAISNNGNKLLAFSDNSNQVAVIDTATKAVTMVSGFDHPVSAVFSSDDATAYVLSCGIECGGTTTKVNTLTMSSNAVGADVIVSGATTALLDSGNLYVAGNSGANGKLDIIAVSTMTVTKSGVAITNGFHSVMALGANGRLFIGSTGCGNISSGCLSVYNTGSSSVVNSAGGAGDVTGLQPISGRSVVYVIEGGELIIWDTTTDAPLPANKQVDIVGQAWDVKLID
jgi:DNA-binding beta-propeller fold protein YncE